MKKHIPSLSTTAWVSPPPLLYSIKHILHFLKKPQQNIKNSIPQESRLQVFTYLFLAKLTLIFFVVISIGGLYHIFDINIYQSSLSKVLNSKSVLLVIGLLFLYGPIRDEIIFRLPLIYSRRSVLIATIMFCAAIGPIVMSEASIGLMYYIIISALFIALVIFLLTSPHFHSLIRQPWKTDYSKLFYITTLLFALQHLIHFPFIDFPIYLLPVIVFVQWIEGLFLGYVRINLGFGWSVAQHILSNGILIGAFYSIS
jgi:hypothetical protein